MMNIEQFATKIVTSPSLNDKISPYEGDFDPQLQYPSCRIDSPGRSSDLQIVPGKQAKVPKIDGMEDLQQRKKIIHAFVTHNCPFTVFYIFSQFKFLDRSNHKN